MLDGRAVLISALLAGATSAAAFGCSSADSDDGAAGGTAGAGSGGTSGTGGGAGASTGGTAGSAGSGGNAGSAAGGTSSTFSIQFDYRFDTKGLFQDAARRVALEAAGNAWAALIAEEFDDIPAGTTVLSRDPENPTAPGQTFTFENSIDDLVVFVGFGDHDGPGGTLASSFPSAAIGSVTDPALAAKLSERHTGPDFEPWTGWISFDPSESWFFDTSPQTADDIPAGQMDFITVAVHELGHVLGFGTAQAHFALVSGTTFTGSSGVAAHGAPVPLTSNGKHIQKGVLVDGMRPLMDPSDPSGERSLHTRLDLAMLEDIGFSFTPEAP